MFTEGDNVLDASGNAGWGLWVVLVVTRFMPVEESAPVQPLQRADQ